MYLEFGDKFLEGIPKMQSTNEKNWKFELSKIKKRQVRD